VDTIVVTANRYQSNHQSLIGNTSVIAETMLEQINAQHLNQVLSLSSGTWLSRGNGQESLLSIRSPVLTGAGSCAEFLTLENGISLRAPGFCNVNQLFDTHFEASNDIEVVKGSNSARYGSNAIHGTINVISNPISADNTAAIDFGSNEFYRFNGAYANTQQDVNWGIAATVTSDGGYQDSSGYQQQKLSFAAEHSLGDWLTTHRFTFTHLDQDTAGYLQQGEDAYKDKSLLKINAFPDAYRKSQSLRYSMQNLLSDGDTQWLVTPYLRYTNMDFLMHFLPGTPVEENGHQSIGLQAKRNSALSDALTLQLGIDTDYTQGFLKQTQYQDTESGSAFLRAVLPKGKQYDYDVDALNIAPYAQLDHRISEQQNAFLAVRYDYTHYDYTNYLSVGNLKEDGTECSFGGCRYTRPADQSNTFNNPSFTLGYSFALNINTLLFAKYDDSFRAPHTSELYRLQNGQLIADIDSVNAKQQEIGIRYSNEVIFTEISIYNLDKTNGIYQDSDRQYLNGIDTKHQGIEVDLNWQIMPSLSARLNTSYARHTYENNPTNGSLIEGNDIDTAPQLMANAIVDWQALETINLQLEARHLDGYFLDADNNQEYDGHTIANLRTKWQVSENFATSLEVLNLFDTRYAERADFAFGNHRYFIGEPRNFNLNISYQF
jgi:outer membrane receptor protein involved in Fe transport